MAHLALPVSRDTSRPRPCPHCMCDSPSAATPSSASSNASPGPKNVGSNLRTIVIGMRPGTPRPTFLFASRDADPPPPALGVVASDHALLYILACPSRPYFQCPISLLAVNGTVRAWPGDTGGDKVGGNYAPGFLPHARDSRIGLRPGAGPV